MGFCSKSSDLKTLSLIRQWDRFLFFKIIWFLSDFFPFLLTKTLDDSSDEDDWLFWSISTSFESFTYLNVGTNMFSLQVLFEDLKDEAFELDASESFFFNYFDGLSWLCFEKLSQSLD